MVYARSDVGEHPLQTLEAVRAASDCLDRLSELGFDVEATNNPTRIPEFTSAIGKPYITKPMSPDTSGMTRKNMFWLLLVKEGQPVGCVGARKDDIGDEPILVYWQREFRRFFPESAEVIGSLTPTINRELRGDIAYIGDLYVHTSFRGSREVLRLLFGVLHSLVALEWSVNSSYAFMRSEDVMKGMSVRYGFTMNFPSPKTWPSQAPEGRYLDESLVVLPSCDTALVLADIRQKLGKV